MANSMDTILVTFGASVEGSKVFSDAGQEQLKQARTMPITEFFEVNANDLTDVERRIRNALEIVYKMNGNESSLYGKFPTFRSDEHPLSHISKSRYHSKKGIL